MTINENIKAFRKQKDLTLEQLAKKCGTTKQTIHRYETGEVKNIPYDMIVSLSKALDVSCADLMGWETEVPKVENVEAHIELIRLYDKLTPEQQKAILQTMRTMAN